MMEADSTTYENNQKVSSFEPSLPFPVHPGNLQFYKRLAEKSSEVNYQKQLIRKLQEINLIPKTRECPDKKPDCCMKFISARVVDRFQWMCNECKTRLPVRGNSFFLRIHCTLLQSLQMILAWCEDADWQTAAENFDVKPKVAYSIYDKLDQLSIDEHSKCKLGGENGVVLAEIYPDCLNRLSPDTTDQPHVHRVLMLADTNHIPTRYWLHVIKDSASAAEVSRVLKKAVIPGSTIVVGNYVPMIPDAVSLQTLTQHCDAEMQHFLCERIWRQAVSICAASRDICAGGACNAQVQKYLTTSLYRLQYGDGFYQHILSLIAAQHTKEDNQNQGTDAMEGSNQTQVSDAVEQSHHIQVSYTKEDSNHIQISYTKGDSNNVQVSYTIDESHQTKVSPMNESHQNQVSHTLDESQNVDNFGKNLTGTQNVVELQTIDFKQHHMEIPDSQNIILDSEKTVKGSQYLQLSKNDLYEFNQGLQNTMLDSHQADASYYDLHESSIDQTDDSLYEMDSQIDSSYYTNISNHTIDASLHAIDASPHAMDASLHSMDASLHYIDASNYDISPTHIEASLYTADELNSSTDESDKDFYTLQNVPID